MSIVKGEEFTARFSYDFAVSGGAVSTINLVNKDNITLGANCFITDVYVAELTALAGATATVTIGTTGDKDGFFADVVSLLGSQHALRAGELAGALIWDDTNDHHIAYRPAADITPCIEIGTAALTAGKFDVYIKFYQVA
jgi:hypothetical protein